MSDAYPNAIYVHCHSHVINLALAGACTGFASVGGLFDNVAKIASSLGDGAKRKEMFKEIAATEPNDKLTALLTECDDVDAMITKITRRMKMKTTTLKEAWKSMMTFVSQIRQS